MKHIRKLKSVNKAWIGLIFIGNGVLLAISYVYDFWQIYFFLLAAVLFTIVSVFSLHYSGLSTWAFLEN